MSWKAPVSSLSKSTRFDVVWKRLHAYLLHAVSLLDMASSMASDSTALFCSDNCDPSYKPLKTMLAEPYNAEFSME
jgi:hypothetical protein